MGLGFGGKGREGVIGVCIEGKGNKCDTYDSESCEATMGEHRRQTTDLQGTSGMQIHCMSFPFLPLPSTPMSFLSSPPFASNCLLASGLWQLGAQPPKIPKRDEGGYLGGGGGGGGGGGDGGGGDGGGGGAGGDGSGGVMLALSYDVCI